MNDSQPLRSDDFDQLPLDARQVLVALNPRAGAGSSERRVHRLSKLLSDAGFDAAVLTSLGEVADRAARLHEVGSLRALVAAGGDGTVAEILNRTAPGIPIVVLPLGTENLLAKYVGLNRGPEAVSQAIVDGGVARLDACRAGDRLFLLMASAGFDADVVGRLHAARRGNISHLSYVKPILESVRSYQYPPLRIRLCDAVTGETQQVREVCGCWVFVFNLPCYGLGLRFTPLASGLDGSLDVCAFRCGSLWHGINYLRQVWWGSHEHNPDAVLFRGKKLVIESDSPVPYQLDGDPGGTLPVEIEVVPQRLTLIVPRQWIESNRTMKSTLNPFPQSLTLDP